MILSTLINYLEEKIPLDLQESYDNCGLLLGEPENEIDRALLSLDITEEIIGEAIQIGANLIISHHPIFFKGLKSISQARSSDRALVLAIKHNLAIYAMHTNLDKVYNGISFQMAKILGLENLEFLKPGPSLTSGATKILEPSGLGVVGYLKSPMRWEDFAIELKEKMRVRVIRHTIDSGKLISKIGLCGGSGSVFLKEAINSGCEVYISADFKYHDFFLEKQGIIIADIGHYESEQFCPLLIREIISKKFPTFALSLTKLNTNPIHYSY